MIAAVLFASIISVNNPQWGSVSEETGFSGGVEWEEDWRVPLGRRLVLTGDVSSVRATSIAPRSSDPECEFWKMTYNHIVQETVDGVVYPASTNTTEVTDVSWATNKLDYLTIANGRGYYYVPEAGEVWSLPYSRRTEITEITMWFRQVKVSGMEITVRMMGHPNWPEYGTSRVSVNGTTSAVGVQTFTLSISNHVGLVESVPISAIGGNHGGHTCFFRDWSKQSYYGDVADVSNRNTTLSWTYQPSGSFAIIYAYFTLGNEMPICFDEDGVIMCGDDGKIEADY